MQRLHPKTTEDPMTDERMALLNGYREHSLDTRLGSLQLRIPKLRQSSYFPPFLEPRKTAEKALVTVIQEAWIGGVSTGRVDLLRARRRRMRWSEEDRHLISATAGAPKVSTARQKPGTGWREPCGVGSRTCSFRRY
jgi:transposase-like protein